MLRMNHPGKKKGVLGAGALRATAPCGANPTPVNSRIWRQCVAAGPHSDPE